MNTKLYFFHFFIRFLNSSTVRAVDLNAHYRGFESALFQRFFFCQLTFLAQFSSISGQKNVNCTISHKVAQYCYSGISCTQQCGPQAICHYSVVSCGQILENTILSTKNGAMSSNPGLSKQIFGFFRQLKVLLNNRDIFVYLKVPPEPIKFEK